MPSHEKLWGTHHSGRVAIPFGESELAKVQSSECREVVIRGVAFLLRKDKRKATVCRSDRIGPYAQNCNFILTLSLLRNFDGLFCAFDCFKSEFIVQMRKILCFLLTFAVSVRESSLVPFDIFPRLAIGWHHSRRTLSRSFLPLKCTHDKKTPFPISRTLRPCGSSTG